MFKIFNYLIRFFIIFIFIILYLINFFWNCLIKFDILKILVLPFYLFICYYEYKLIHNKKIFKKIKNFKIYYNYLLASHGLPKLNSKIFLINYYKLFFWGTFMDNFSYFLNLLKIGYLVLPYVKTFNPRKLKFLNAFFFLKKKIRQENSFIVYIKMLRRDYFSDYLIKYWIGWAENRFRDFRSIIWDWLRAKKEQITLPFIQYYCAFIFGTFNRVSYMPFGLFYLFIYFISLVTFLFVNLVYNWSYNKYTRFKLKLNKKIKRFKEYSIWHGFKSIIIISYIKYTKSIPDYSEFYRWNLKYTKLGKIFGPIYNALGLWHGFKKGRLRGFKKMK